MKCKYSEIVSITGLDEGSILVTLTAGGQIAAKSAVFGKDGVILTY